MNLNAFELLEFNKIIENLKDYAMSDLAKKKIDELRPAFDMNVIGKWQRDTTEARAIVNRSSSVPIHSLIGIENIMSKLDKNSILSPEELTCIKELLAEGQKLKKFMSDKEYLAPIVSSYALSIYEIKDMEEEIERCIHRSDVVDKASSNLAKTRKKISILEERIKVKLNNLVKNPSYKKYLQDNVVSLRNGRYVIPVKSEFKREVEGNVLDSSASGSTVFIEPPEIKKAQDELNILRIEEDKEVYKILSYLTGLVEQNEREIMINIENMVHYDFIFAKAKYSKAIDGNSVILNRKNYINIIKGKHPLIGKGAIPLEFTIGKDYRSLVITGPNTGGKTVALKTVGLLTMMVQSGLHVTVEEGSEFAIFADILVDIGDGQSIEQSLSTFSSHIKKIINITECADPYSLVIIDEIGSGTDPGEGMGIAIAVLEKIYEKGATILATTHYSEIKQFAEESKGFKNGRMEFDIETLKPLYKLVIGEAGESNAFFIALRLGMDKNIIERAHKITYKEEKLYLEFKNTDTSAEGASGEEDKKSHEDAVVKLTESSEKDNKKASNKRVCDFNIGDCVLISTMNRTGIVCELENSKGELGVIVMKKKLKINHKRLSIYVSGEELYPEDYDYDIVLESKENRKKKKLMNKRHVEGLAIEYDSNL